MSIIAALAGYAMLASTPAFTPAPCPAPIADKARCGTVEVLEDRARPEGRRIRLNVVVLPSLRPELGLAPMYDIDGGPGLPVSKNAFFYLGDGAAYRDREIVMVDQRGTGASHPLRCPELETASLKEAYPADAVRRCRAALEATADLTRYGTEDAVADLEDVRRALGHDRIDLFGLSYGTTVALRYIAAHPQRVRAAVLWGAAPATARPPSGHAVNAEATLRQLFADCAADPACAAAYPALETALDGALAALPRQGEPSREVFAEKLRSLMYTPMGQRRLPAIVHAAARGDLAPFRDATGAGPMTGLAAEGMYLSVTCAESLAGHDPAAAVAASRQTRFGDYRLRRQTEACRDWPAAPVDPGFYAPVRAETPVLLVSGGRDPATPAKWAAEIARDLPNARQVVVEHGGHLFDGLANVDCIDRVILAFYAAGSAKGLDTACVATMTPPPFAPPG